MEARFTGMSFDPVLQDIEMRQRNSDAEAVDERIESVLYEAADIRSLLQYELGRVHQGAIRFSQPIIEEVPLYLPQGMYRQAVQADQRNIIFIPLKDDQWYSLCVDSCRYGVSQYQEKSHFDDRYATVPYSEKQILFEGFFRQPTESEKSEGFESPVFMLSPIDLTLDVITDSEAGNYLDTNAQPKGKYRECTLKSQSLLKIQSQGMLEIIPSIGNFIRQSSWNIVPGALF